MRQALYRKYRPKTLSEVVGQEYLKVTLTNQLAGGQIGHAYLFSGPKGTGKTTVARIVAKSVNCLSSKDGTPCGKCDNCASFENGQMIDLIEIDAASNRSIDNIRELISKIALAPSVGKYKIYVIDEAHQLTKDASNALLKTLEEPPSHAIFVLATTEPEKLLPTIVSRCQHFEFRYVPLVEQVKYLGEVAKAEKIKISADGLEFIARQSGGGMRDAMSLLEQASFIEGEITQITLAEWLGLVAWQTVYELTMGLVAGDAKGVIAKINELYVQGYDLSRLTASWITTIRQVLAVKLGNGDTLSVGSEQIAQLQELSEKLPLNKIVVILQELMGASREVKVGVVPQLALEIAVVKLAGVKDDDNKPNQEPPSEPQATSHKPPAKQPQEDSRQPLAKMEQEPSVGGQPVMSEGELVEVWPKVLEQMRGLSPTLAGALNRTTVEVGKSGVVVKFTSRFHKEKMEQPNSMGLLTRAFTEVGYECRIRCEVMEVAEDKPIDIKNVSEVFGEMV